MALKCLDDVLDPGYQTDDGHGLGTNVNSSSQTRGQFHKQVSRALELSPSVVFQDFSFFWSILMFKMGARQIDTRNDMPLKKI